MEERKMLCVLRRCVTVLLAVMLVILEPLMTVGPEGLYSGYGKAYASVGSVAEGSDVIYDKTGGVLNSLGFDTSKMPEDYDANATTNPYGSDVSTLNEIKELVILDTLSGKSTTYGHDRPIDAGRGSFFEGERQNTIRKDANQEHKINTNAYISAVKCDLNGNGRDSGVAIVYTNYNSDFATIIRHDGTLTEEQRAARLHELQSVYMRIYDPISGILSGAIKVAEFDNSNNANLTYYDYFLQSQMQITAGDYDKDSIDEIAVYAPSGNGKDRNKVTIFDLTDGKDCEDPYSEYSWREAWNYVLPLSDSEVVDFGTATTFCVKNVYNNLDLSSGDADNDGICDLIISYGSSETDFEINQQHTYSPTKVRRYDPSNTVLLYGSDTGQMLRDVQKLDYDDNVLIRVSTSFGDIDDDGNEDLFIAGQLQSEADSNETRVLGKYIYDEGSGGMELESIQDMKVVEGSWTDSHFYSSNGWNGAYFSTPMMNTNLAIGKFMGDSSETRIYLDSVLYSYDDGEYEIVDELEDASMLTDDEGNPTNTPKGSMVFTDIMSELQGTQNMQCWYYEFGADSGYFTGSLYEQLIVSRVSVDKAEGSEGHIRDVVEAKNSILYYSDAEKKLKRVDLKEKPVEDPNDKTKYNSCLQAPPRIMITADTDIDSMVATYTGEHEIVYQSPRVLAVLTAAPYFKDVSDFSGGSLASGCSTTFGDTDGDISGENHAFNYNVGAFLNVNVGIKVIYGTVKTTGGYARSKTWGNSETTSFKMSYKTGGEDAVVMYSIPTENYKYVVEGITVDDDGNFKKCRQTLIVAKPHKPVTQTLNLDDYKEIQKRNSSKIPDVTKYFSSTPGDPSSYPKSENDLTKDAKSKLGEVKTFKQFAGVSYGSGNVTQAITYSKNDTTTVLNGGYFSINAGLGGTRGGATPIDVFGTVEGGLNFSFTRTDGGTTGTVTGNDCSGTVPNMPKAAKGYGYDFSWKLLKYEIEQNDSSFYVITYIVNDVSTPPKLPDNIQQDFDNTTDSQIALTWTYNHGNPQAFDVYRYEDFPQGGGDKLVGTVAGGNYRTLKDADGKTVLDDQGHVIRQYTFTDTDLTADSKYDYRLKVRSSGVPPESIFSPIIEARTDVGTKPAISLSTDDLTIYPDSVYTVRVKLEDPENYQKDISYQWQKYDDKTKKWDDVDGCTTSGVQFYNCSPDDEGRYRCRVNLIRKVESHPQYISAYTEACTVRYSLRTVKFGDIDVEETRNVNNEITSTSLSVSVANADKASHEKPTGVIQFTFKGPNGTIQFETGIDEGTGIARVPSVEELIGDIGTESLVKGGYVVSARYEGNAIFYPADDPDDYHYLRNISECVFLSTKSAYYFGDDIAPTAELADYKKDKNNKVTRTDLAITRIKVFKVDEDGKNKTGDAIADYDMTESGAKAPVPLNPALAKKAYVEAWMKDESGDEVLGASNVIDTAKVEVEIDVKEKLTGTGQLIEFMDEKDVTLSNGNSPTEVNIETADGKKSLYDFMRFDYYEQNGDFICDSSTQTQHVSDFIPAAYYVTVEITGDDAPLYYKPSYKGARFTVVGNYYLVTARAEDPNTGSVKMISPDTYTDFEKKGYPGGTKLILQAVPDLGYEIDKWTIDELGRNPYDVEGSDKITYTVKSKDTATLTDGTVNIRAVMKPKNNILTFSELGRGKIQVSPAIESGAIVLADTSLTFKAIPDPGWQFDEWRWMNIGGNNIISGGITTDQDTGENTKTFTMTDNSVELYAVFSRDTIDIAVSNDFDVLYINDGSNPRYEVGAEVLTEKGRNVPKGATVIVRTKPGVVLAPGSSWDVEELAPGGIIPEPENFNGEIMSAGQPACTFKLDDYVTACSVSRDAAKGRYSVEARAEGVDFIIVVDGNRVAEPSNVAYNIEAGSQVEVQALPGRDRHLTDWIVNGEETGSNAESYSFIINENMSLSAETKIDEKYQLSLSTTGGGTASYVITTRSGIPIPGYFSGDPTPEDVYKGEKVTIQTSRDDLEHTMTAIFVNGDQKDFDDDGSYTIDPIEGNTDVVCRFGSNAYYTAAFRNEMRKAAPTIYDSENKEIQDGAKKTVPNGGTLDFSVQVVNTAECYVYASGQILDPVDAPEDAPEVPGGMVRKYYRITNFKGNKDIVITDHEVIYIPDGRQNSSDEQQLRDYFRIITEKAASGNQPDGILTKDIEINSDDPIDLPDDFCAMFDGQGHTIKGLRIGSQDSRIANFNGIFGDIATNAGVTDLLFDDVIAYVDYNPKYSNLEDTWGSGLLCNSNDGTISGVAFINTTYDVNTKNSEGVIQQVPAGLFSFDNYGTIENCMSDSVTIISDAEEPGSAITAFNGQIDVAQIGENALISGCFINDFKVKGAGDRDPKYPTQNIVVQNIPERNHGTINNNNYYKTVYDANDPNGISVYTLTENPDDEDKAEAEAATSAFSRKIAYTMNTVLNDKVWGTKGPGDDDKALLQIRLGGGVYKAPIKATFINNKMVVRYCYPGRNTLPGTDEFGQEDTPEAWDIDGNAYAPDAEALLTEDMEITAADLTRDYVASVSDIFEDDEEQHGTVYYKNANAAFLAAEDRTGENLLRIYGKCDLSNGDYTVGSHTVVEISGSAVFTIKNSADITNRGLITVLYDDDDKPVVHKYGAIVNYGTVVIPEGAEFYNYGSDFDDKHDGTTDGKVKDRENITCKPHITGEWIYNKTPDAEGKWTRRCFCKVCNSEIEEQVEPDPPVSRISSIVIDEEPEDTSYEVGDKFREKGLVVAAILTDGSKAAISDYKLRIKVGIVDKELKDGDVLTTSGNAVVTASYENFKASFTMTIKDRTGTLIVTDMNGRTITSSELTVDRQLALRAALASGHFENIDFKWESTDKNVAALADASNTEPDDKALGKNVTLVAAGTGSATIKVTAIDESGETVDGIPAWTISVRVVSHITELKILSGDFTIWKNETKKVPVRIKPDNATDRVTWYSSDDSVATVDDDGIVTGVKGGDAVITVSGNGLHDSCKVHVKELASNMTLDPVSMELATGGYDVITARTDSVSANGTVEWTTDNVKVAGFFVKNEKTGVMEVVDSVTTDLSPYSSYTSDTYVVIAGVKGGEAKITARTAADKGGYITKECAVTVTKKEKYIHITQNGLPVSDSHITVKLSDRGMKLGAVSSEEDDKFIWTTVDDRTDPVLTVYDNGAVTFNRKGTAAVRVTSEETGDFDILLITVYVEPTAVKLDKDEITLKIGDSSYLRASLVPEDAEGSIVWKSEDESIAVVEPDGKVTAVAVGQVKITAVCKAAGVEEAEGTAAGSGAGAEQGAAAGAEQGAANGSGAGTEQGAASGAARPVSASCIVSVTGFEPQLDVILSADEFYYDGMQQIPLVTVRNGDIVLGENLAGSNANVVLITNTESSMYPGTYKVTAIARDWRYGSGEAIYSIKTEPTVLTSLKKGKKKFTAKWNKLPKNYVKGYQVRWSRKKNMKGAKSKYIKTADKGSLTVKKLKARKRYYVQIRTYVQDKNGNKYYSDWSPKKSIKTKK